MRVELVIGLVATMLFSLVGVVWSLINRRIDAMSEEIEAVDRRVSSELHAMDYRHADNIKTIYEKLDSIQATTSKIHLDLVSRFVSKQDCERIHQGREK